MKEGRVSSDFLNIRFLPVRSSSQSVLLSVPDFRDWFVLRTAAGIDPDEPLRCGGSVVSKRLNP
jgi:hypothetical protein